MTEVQQTEKVTPRLKTKYRDEIRGALQEQFQYGNVMQVPGLVKVVVNMGVGEAAKDSKIIDGAVADLTAITCLLYTSPSPRDATLSRMPSSA